jgi:hypothetical protein
MVFWGIGPDPELLSRAAVVGDEEFMLLLAAKADQLAPLYKAGMRGRAYLPHHGLITLADCLFQSCHRLRVDYSHVAECDNKRLYFLRGPPIRAETLKISEPQSCGLYILWELF